MNLKRLAAAAEQVAAIIRLSGEDRDAVIRQVRRLLDRRGPLQVRCVETGEVFFSAGEAAKKYGVSAFAINQAILFGSRSGFKKRGTGYHWEHVRKEET